MKSKPLISIITVCYNSEKTIKDTIESVLNQTYTNIEYILIDGKSIDSTVEIIKSYEVEAKEKGIIYRWISEPDKGIYDAMNKGIDLVTGEYINFMNSGDSFVNNDILKVILKQVTNEEDIIYGDVIIKFDQNNKKILFAREIKSFYKGIPFCHQSCFIKSNLMKEEKYDLKYQLCSDYDFFYNMYMKKKKYKYIKLPIAIYDYYGVSSNLAKTFAEKKKIVLFYEPKYSLYLYFLRIKNMIKFFLPLFIIRKIQTRRKRKFYE